MSETEFPVSPAGCAIGAVVGSLVLLSINCFTVISPGFVGVYSVFGSVRDQPLQPGFHLVNPVGKVSELSIQIQRHEADYNAASSDMQTVATKMVINYSLIGTEAPRVYQEIGEGYEKTIIDPAAQEVLKAVMAQFQASEILHQRQQIKTRVQEGLSLWLEKYGIKLAEISIAEITFDAAYAEAIEAKQVQEQRAQQKEYEFQQAQVQARIVAANAEGEAQARTARARAEAEATRVQAEGEAQALRARADAQAEYNRKVSESLTPTLIRQQYLDKWNGVLPRIVSDGDFLFTLGAEE